MDQDNLPSPWSERFSVDVDSVWSELPGPSDYHSIQNSEQPGVLDYLSAGHACDTGLMKDNNDLLLPPFNDNLDYNGFSHPIGAGLNRFESGNYPETCFGAITNVMAMFEKSPPRIDLQPEYYSLSICKYGNYYGLWSDKSQVAILDKKACNVLRELEAFIDIGVIRLKAITSSAQWLATKSSKSKTAMVDLNMYGLRTEADGIGKLLNLVGITLQQPLCGLQGYVYYNPHFLHIDRILGEEVQETPLVNIVLGNTNASSTLNHTSAIVSITVDAGEEVAMIFDTLTHHGILNKRDTDERMKTKLLDHQKTAVDFMLRRETGDLPTELTMWREFEDDDGDIVYQHIITGSRRPQIVEAKGGILADEMGLGKSIVSLSVIAASVDRAYEFGKRTTMEYFSASNRTCSKATLIIAPSSLLIASWIDEIHKHTYPGSLKIWKYHGAGRQNDVEQLYSSDIVLTTYATVAMEFSGSKKVLKAIEWFRIILDEAHDIRNRSTKQFQVVADLSAQHRWCLSGTPIQNSLEDLGALVAFLRIPVLENPETFRKFIVSQSTSKSSTRFEHLRLLLESICLRRTREIVGLIDPIVEDRKINFTPDEREEYIRIVHSSKIRIEAAVTSHGKGVNSAVLESLLRLRLFCNNGLSDPHSARGASGVDGILSYLQQFDLATCAYCFRSIDSIDIASDTDGGTLMSKCYHLACRECLTRYYAEKKRCPECRAGNRDPEIAEAIREIREPKPITESHLHGITFPSKIEALANDLEDHQRHKSIVFSSWKTTLDLVGRALTRQRLNHLYIHGSVALRERKRILDDFRNATGPNILLMTLGTGAVGLNLAIASRIYILEPQWNPSVELQARSRALRLDQKEKVTIIRYIVQNSVEESTVLSGQTKKLREAQEGFKKHGRGVPSNRMQECLNLFAVSGEDSRHIDTEPLDIAPAEDE